MTSVDDFVRANILSFPSLFPNRTKVLHHALCVIGNGFHWSADGFIVDSFNEQTPLWDKAEKTAAMEAEVNRSFKNPETRDYMMNAMLADIEDQAKTVEEVETRIHERTELKQIYPQSDYALLMNIPANVTPDWQEACDEMKQLAEKAGWTF